MIAENEGLRAELNRTLESKALAAALAEGGGLAPDSTTALIREEADLLRQVGHNSQRNLRNHKPEHLRIRNMHEP